jgi:superoxide dismutase, Fe-Mn family
MTFILPDLKYKYNELEPYIDAKTMEIHYTKHHDTYVKNLNKAVEGHENIQNKPLEEILSNIDQVPENIRTAVRNNGGGHLNHTLFWEYMSPDPKPEPEGRLAEAIDEAFGSFSLFKEEFTKAALNRFGSGWAWLVKDRNKLKVYSTPNQDNPLMEGFQPVLGLDVWEHAYYLKYQNKRPEYVENWWNVVNWEKISLDF